MSGSVERHVVTRAEGGQRLDRIVAALESVGSRRRARHAIESGKISVDGETVGPSDLGRSVPAGALVVLEWNRPGTARPQALARQGLADTGLSIVHEDPAVLVVEKPAGLLTDTATREQSLERDSARARLKAYLKAQGANAFIVHRIDRDTSGLLAVAKTPEAADDLKAQFLAHTPERVYWTAVQGVPRAPDGTWSDRMVWDKRRLVQRSPRPEELAEAALATAHYRVLEAFPPHCAILEVRLVTGRRNQIRLHCQLRGHPLLGEKLYLPKDFETLGPPSPRQALHAWRLAFRHPVTGQQVAFESLLPPDLRALARRMARWRR